MSAGPYLGRKVKMRTTRTGRASRLERRIRCVFLLCFLRCFLRCFLCFYSLADSGERRKPRRTGHSGVRGGQDKEFVFKLSWPSTAEYRMMKLKKKKRSSTPGSNSSGRLNFQWAHSDNCQHSSAKCGVMRPQLDGAGKRVCKDAGRMQK